MGLSGDRPEVKFKIGQDSLVIVQKIEETEVNEIYLSSKIS